MSAVAQVQTESITRLEEKFMRLLETDRTSKEFEALFEEVDAELARCVCMHTESVLRSSR